MSLARARLGMSPSAWWPIVLAASHCRQKMENGPTYQFASNLEQVEG